MSSFEDYYYKNVAKKIRFYREKNSITQEELSDIIGKNIKYIGHIERCERYISNKMLIKLIEYFKIQPEDFFKFDDKFMY